VRGNFRNDFRRFFIRGLAAVLPTILTIIVIVWIFTLIQKYIGTYINKAVQWCFVQYYCLINHIPFHWKGPDNQWDLIKSVWHQYHLGWIGFILAFVAVYIFGRFVASFIGRNVWAVIDQTLSKTPVIKQIYPGAKQVTDFLLNEQRVEFSRVVAVEYPRKGIWSLGLVTGSGIDALRKKLQAELVTVFVPSSPSPITGYTIVVRRDEVIDLPLTIEEALRFTISAGVLTSPPQKMEEKIFTRFAPKVLIASKKSPPEKNEKVEGKVEGKMDERRESENSKEQPT